MNIFEKISSGPLITLVAGIAATLAAITDLTSRIGLRPFWADTLASIFFLTLFIYWLFIAIKSLKFKKPTIIIHNDSNKYSIKINLISLLFHIIVLAIFLALSAWFAIPPTLHLTTPDWQICGTINTQCGKELCVIGLDERFRKISSECQRPKDVTGYFFYSPKDLTTYLPHKLLLSCNNSEIVVDLPKEFKSPRCNGVIKP